MQLALALEPRRGDWVTWRSGATAYTSRVLGTDAASCGPGLLRVDLGGGHGLIYETQITAIRREVR